MYAKFSTNAMVRLLQKELARMYANVFKRVFDIIIALIAMPFLGILLLIVGPMIYFEDKGPIFYNAPRVGKNGVEFKMYKLRSMKVNAPDLVMADGSTYNGEDDPRLTKVGSWLRKTSMDEMPQFINVLKGDMSLVGPRPERPQFVEKFKEEIPRYMIKHQVRPGITGWAQVNGLRGDTSIRRRIEFDLYYIENWTIGLDFKILFQTVFKGFKNAY